MVKRRKNRLLTDALREVRRTRNRFFSLFILSALAVAFLAGLRTTAPDMKYTADQYFDRQNLMDIRVLSTLGLTQEDLTALAGLEGISAVEGERSFDAVCGDKILSVISLPGEIDRLALQAGRLPEADDECVTEQAFLDSMGMEVGDTLVLDLETSDHVEDLTRDSFTIVGVVDSPMYISVDRGSSTLGTGRVNAFVMLPEAVFTADYYTAAYLTVEGMAALNCYSDEYEDRMDAWIDGMEDFANQRALLRYESLVGDAQAELDDARSEYEEKKAEAELELSDAEKELADARQALDEGWADYEEGRRTLATETADAKKKIAEAEQELADAEKELADALIKLNDGETDYNEGLRKLDDGEMEYADNWFKLEDAQTQYDDGWAEYQDGLTQLEEAGAQLMDAERQLEDARSQLASGSASLSAGRRELETQKQSYQTLNTTYGGVLLALQTRGLTIPPDPMDPIAVGTFGTALADWAMAQQDGAQTLQDQVVTPLRSLLGAFLTQIEPTSEQGIQLQDLLLMLPEDVAGLSELLETDPTNGVTTLTTGVLGGIAASGAGLAAMDQALQAGEAQLAAGSASLSAGSAQYQEGLKEYKEGKKEFEDSVVQLQAAGQELLDAKTELDDGWAQLADGRAELDDGWAELADARQELDDGWREYRDGLTDYEEGVTELSDARMDLASETARAQTELNDAWHELNDGETEYADGLREYRDGKAEADVELADAEKKLTDAQNEINDIEDCEWYVLGRNSLVGYVTYGSDSERMSNLADVFPLIFFLVAALACLTTMTRMVEEQRTQIGCLKALGFKRRAIAVKYIGYAFSASFLGGLVGAVLGCIVIPWVIYNAWGIMYTLPSLIIQVQPGICVVAILAAVVCTTGASLMACLSTLTATPSDLMRPRAPKVGKRVLLERVTPIWKRMKFIQKVTVRNLFRYKRRFWMTVIGIGGCTALIVTGFGLHNSIFDILEKQYDEISPYNASAGLNEDITAGQLEVVTDFLEESPLVRSYLTSYQSTVDVTSDSSVVDGVNLFAVDDLDAFSEYIHLRHRGDGSAAELPVQGIVITEKLSELLDVKVGDFITIDGDKRVTMAIGDIVENYVYHYIYLTEDYYEALFGSHPVHNTLMLNFTSDSQGVSDQVSTDLMKLDGVSSYTHIAYIRDTFTDSMASIDYAVMIIILSAAALAFVVLYNLTNINITERMRELATLKVLGFYDKEVSAYVYRENIFLTLFGIVLGLGMGRFLHAWLVKTVEVNMVMFGRTAAPSSYVWAAVLTVVFSLIVNIVAHYSLKKIDMVESLKTVE